jgi:hypothetical protein
MGWIDKEVHKSLIEGTIIFDSKVMFHKNMNASKENKGDFDASQISGEYGKNIDGRHKIFDINTKRFFLVRDDIEQCLTALRTQSVSKEILEAVKDIMFENTVESRLTISQSNAKKRPPSSEFGNTMNSNPSNDDTAHQILCVPCPPKKKVRKCEEADCTKAIKMAGRCASHGPKCEEADCTKAIKMAGRCASHGPKCGQAGCTNTIKKAGRCKTHCPK